MTQITIDELLSDAAAKGWLVNNCYQNDEGVWFFSMRRPEGTGDWFTAIAMHMELRDAIEEVMSQLHDAEFEATPEILYKVDTSKPKISLGQLGLGQRQTVMRRI